MSNFDSGSYTPKKIGNFNVPKTLIECKVDTLAFLEVLLRKNIATWDEIEEIREAVVLHMNVMYPELQFSYTTPQPLKDQAPITPPDEPAKPLFYSAPPPEVLAAQQGGATSSPLYASAQPKIMPGNAAPKVTQQTVRTEGVAPAAGGEVKATEAPKPFAGGQPKIMTNVPRKKI